MVENIQHQSTFCLSAWETQEKNLERLNVVKLSCLADWDLNVTRAVRLLCLFFFHGRLCERTNNCCERWKHAWILCTHYTYKHIYIEIRALNVAMKKGQFQNDRWCCIYSHAERVSRTNERKKFVLKKRHEGSIAFNVL